ncbi:uroporphyrinogen decarboxylase family protein [bacterium]|nr:uroporphyrinogen decarboxylase family protein [bacterium]
MTPRENLRALLDGEPYESVPIWLMGFENDELARKLNPGVRFPDSLFHNPETFDYPWDRLSDEERTRTLDYNHAILKPVVVVGWGANMALGHGGPGEFHFRILEVKENELILECETGCKRLVRKHPHFYKDFDHPLRTVDEVDRLVLPDPHDPERYRGIEEDTAFFREAGYMSAANLNGFFSGPHYFCIDYQEFLMSMLLDPPNTKKLIDRIGTWNCAAAEELLSRGVECIVLCDDLGSADNLLMSPDIYRDWIRPWHTKLCNLAHDFGGYVHLHSHGNINKILQYVLETGVDMLNPFDIYESMDLVAFLESANLKTVPVGGCHKFFFDWDATRQNEYLTGLFKRAGNAGRWIFMDTGGISETVDKTMYDFVMGRLNDLSKLR